MHQVKVPEDPVERKRQRESEQIRVELLDGFRAHGVERVGDQRGGGDDGDHLVEQVRAVFLEYSPVAGRAVREEHEFVPPLAEREKQREQDRQHVQPVADRDVDDDRTGRGTHHETDGNRQHVDDHDVLQRARVEREQRDVRRREEAKQGPQPERGGNCDGPERGRGRERCGCRYGA